MKPSRILIAIAALLLSSLACRAATELVFAEAPPESLPANPLSLPPLAPTETDVPLLTCPSVTGSILEVAIGFDEGDPQGDVDIEPDVTYLVTYSVSGDLIESPFTENVTPFLVPFQQDQSRHEEIWNYFITLIPAGERGVLSEFSIMTDGEGNLLAAVAQSSQSPEVWGLEVDIFDTDDRLDLAYTLIHEYAHLLTLKPSQVTPSLPVFNNPDDDDIYLSEVSACPQYFPGEGCAHPDSYINQFYYRFWDDIHEEWQDVNLIEDDDQYYAALDAFYYAYEDRFLTDYAATNPEEDIAESFSFFVLSPRPDGDSLAEEKMLFFYEFPELLRIRKQIVHGICSLNP